MEKLSRIEKLIVSIGYHRKNIEKMKPKDIEKFPERFLFKKIFPRDRINGVTQEKQKKIGTQNWKKISLINEFQEDYPKDRINGSTQEWAGKNKFKIKKKPLFYEKWISRNFFLKFLSKVADRKKMWKIVSPDWVYILISENIVFPCQGLPSTSFKYYRFSPKADSVGFHTFCRYISWVIERIT